MAGKRKEKQRKSITGKEINKNRCKGRHEEEKDMEKDRCEEKEGKQRKSISEKERNKNTVRERGEKEKVRKRKIYTRK